MRPVDGRYDESTPGTSPEGGPNWRLTAGRKRRLLEAVRAGNYVSVAARYAGISPKTFHNYMKKGRELHQQAIDEGILTPDLVEDALERGELLATTGGPNPIGELLRAAGWPEIHVLLVELFDELGAAEAAAEVRLVGLISKAAVEDHRAAMAILSRRWKKRWADASRTEVTGPDGGPVRVDSPLAAALANPAVMAQLQDVAHSIEDSIEGMTDSGRPDAASTAEK